MPKYKAKMTWKVIPIDTTLDPQACSHCEDLGNPGVEALFYIGEVPHCQECLNRFKKMVQGIPRRKE